MKIFKTICSIVLFSAALFGTTTLINTHDETVVHATSSSTTPPAAINEVFPDANFAEVIRQALSKASIADQVTQDDLNSIMTLNANNQNIINISGVEYLASIKTLFLSNNQISDLSPLESASLPQLENLYLSDNQISDITPLATLNTPKLYNIYMYNNQINDLTPLESTYWPDLHTVYLFNNQISDLAPIVNAHWPELQLLQVMDNEISDLTPLANTAWPKLDTLHLSNNQISNLTPIVNANWPILHVFSAGNNQISDPSPLLDASWSSALYSLDLSNNKISDLSPFANANWPDLYDIHLNQNQIADITPLTKANWPTLSSLNLSNNQIIDISALSQANWPSLTWWNISNQSITNSSITWNNQLTITNKATDINGHLIDPVLISDDGTYSDSVISWSTVANEDTSLSYIFNSYVTINGIYSQFYGQVHQPIEKTYNVTFINENQTYKTMLVPKNTFVTEPAAPAKDGYTFDGWYTEAGDKWLFDSNTTPANDIVLYAQYKSDTTVTPAPPIDSTDNTTISLPTTGSNLTEMILLGTSIVIISFGCILLLKKRSTK
ncbi:leucine-rich repeat domain-containing protein [Culicoidibacter larvae]|uniref:LPXTG cell wall anchor domain-containing protein n=1 Tax=Culicoidibacter larvae TaxID=2579976 RepID=A0A5R8QCU0_9FIRM|nr:leucine-rich repeat domain-containing protein [Culicoidibacter larvae]TLG74322.1 hypothetical protein FEZ08_06340 [Culicoidibacter larvae]